MEQSSSKFLAYLIDIGKIDGALARIAADRKRIETDLGQQKQNLKKAQADRDTRAKVLEEKRARYQKEERSLKEEREKLIARRKALSTHNNYKLQQAAEREIDHASRQLSTREEALLLVVDEMDVLEKDCTEREGIISSLKDTLDKALADANATFATFEERQKEYLAQREELVTHVDPSKLSVYDRVRERFPMDAIAPIINNNSCSGCYIQVAPQIIVEITRGTSILKCRGCGRILYLQPEAAEAQASGK